jgi:hypothetical protein
VNHATRPERVKLRLHNSALSVDALKGVAWRGRCACGWQSPHWYLDRADAIRAANEHRLEELGLD